jgi:hypothetical protein
MYTYQYSILIPQKYSILPYHASSYMTLNKYDETYTVFVCPIIFSIHHLLVSCIFFLYMYSIFFKQTHL